MSLLNLYRNELLWQQKYLELIKIVPDIDMKSFTEKFIAYQSSSTINPMGLMTLCIELAAANENFPWESNEKFEKIIK